MIAGRAREMGLGPLHSVTLAEARAKAAAARKLKTEGIDPIEARRAEIMRKRAAEAEAAANRVTFKEAAERYIRSHSAAWRNPKHAAQWPSSLEAYAYPIFGSVTVDLINTGLVLKAIEPIWLSKPETASRVRGRIESILDWARARGYRQGENPARWRGHLDHLLPARSRVRKVEHHPALPFADIGAFMKVLRVQHGAAARALEFTILTAARTSEVLGATWREIDLEVGVWTLPAERMKAGRAHRVALCDEAIELLEKLRQGPTGNLVFPGAKADRPMSNMAMLMLLRRMGRGDLTAHGFRSTFRDWAAECTTHPNEVVEMALAHTIGNKVEAAYRRGDLFDRRRQLMTDWGRYCSAPSQQSVHRTEQHTA
jgi:integrase